MLPIILALHCLFTPPKDWEIADPKTPSSRVLAGFIDKSKSGFCPSLNLTYEEVFIPMDEYLTIVQKNYLSKKQKMKILGVIDTKGGKVHLLEVEAQTKFGPVRLMQALLRKDRDLFILTAGVLKKDFARQAKKIEDAFQSMFLCDDLFKLAGKDSEKLREAWQKKRSGIECSGFEEMVVDHRELGPVWQFLIGLL